MFNNSFINFALSHLPKDQWNHFSSMCASMSIPLIGTPIAFTHRNFHLQEFPPGKMPPDILTSFTSFCYPPELPDRTLQIECDKRNYWNSTTTFIVFNRKDTIAGCVQIIHRNSASILPVEFGCTKESDGRHLQFSLSTIYNPGAMTEIYRCRRSFNLSGFEGMTVVLMLFKAVFAHIIQSGATFSFISFDASRADLKKLYIDKCDFIDTGIDLFYNGDPRPWRLLRKNWFQHEYTYASKGKTQFFIQTWCRQGLKKKHLSHKERAEEYIHDCNLIDSGHFVLAEVVANSPTRLKTTAATRREKAGCRKSIFG